KFRILVDFTDLKVNGAVMAARKDWIATHQRELRDVIKNLFLGARKANADPAWAVEQLKPEFPDENPVFLEAAIKEYASRKVWAPSGAMTKPDDLKEAIAFLKEAGMLDKGAPDDPNFYVDFKALDAVLAEIGVQ
ncbi:MAG: hypothetical protein HYY09_06435, partial [Firmicutes bacterium]|nr:hypothetical protein [Bacillota bacterium]